MQILQATRCRMYKVDKSGSILGTRTQCTFGIIEGLVTSLWQASKLAAFDEVERKPKFGL